MNILVIAGGTSSEREVSLRSGAAVAAALKAAGHAVQTRDTDVDDATLKDYDVVFPVLHGAGGEDGTMQARLEQLGLPYVGSDVASCQLTFDKVAYKAALLDVGIATPSGELVTAQTFRDHTLTSKPFVLKPVDGGSSVDTFIVRDVSAAPWDDMADALQRYGAMLLEELISGTEITVGVVGNQALPVVEIIPPSDGEFDYENKYNGATQELCPPRHVSEVVQQSAQALAARIHELCGCRDLSRTDMIVNQHDELYVLETNTLPGMTEQSLLPKAAAVAGMPMPALCDQLVLLATGRQTDDA